ncbi:LLM class flavin-dependent oxidoreductase [Streptosporangium sp. NPDC000509]|uniref:LLM class flavin-dependent oxidoreductase n=1 Tax=Streptosporangium sp. NPDC000509 TaxID=3366186 RepID=UPI00367D7E69
MEYGVACDITAGGPGLPGEIEAAAAAAETAGLASWWAVGDREQIGGGHDAVLGLQCAARSTGSIRLGLSGDILSIRGPALRAKQVATLDWFAGGRLEYGLDLGEVPLALGGASGGDTLGATSEYLEAMRALWSQRRASHQGERIVFSGAIALPRPAGGRPGIHMRHGGEDVLRLLAREADGWLGWLLTPADLPGALAPLAKAIDDAGRDQGEVRRTWFVPEWEIGPARELLADDPSVRVDELVAVYSELPSPERLRALAGV